MLNPYFTNSFPDRYQELLKEAETERRLRQIRANQTGHQDNRLLAHLKKLLVSVSGQRVQAQEPSDTPVAG